MPSHIKNAKKKNAKKTVKKQAAKNPVGLPPKQQNKQKKKKKIQQVRETYKRAVKQTRVEIKPIKDCQIDKLIKGRLDELELKRHLDAISVHQQKYQGRIDDIKKEEASGNVARVTELPAHKAKVTEGVGERATTLAMVSDAVKKKLGGDTELKRGFSAGTGIDQVWYVPATDTYYLVEAKGPGATLGTTKTKGDQMSNEWIRASLLEEITSSTSSKEAKELAKTIRTAALSGPPPNVRGLVFEAKKGGGADERGCPDKGIYN